MGPSVLLLVTILLVLIAAVTLLIGIFGDNLALIFVSIGSSALAAIVLAVLSQMNKRTAREAETTTGPKPLPTQQAPEPAPVAAAPSVAAVPATVPPPEEPTLVTDALPSDELPIADYDSLRVNEILPALEELDLDQLELVAQHEETTKNRTTVLNRIDELMDQLEAEEAGAAPVAAVADAADEWLEDIEEGEVVPEEKVSTGFPIDDYESLSVDEIIAMIGDLDADELEEVAEYEETHANRDAVLDAIDDRLDELEGLVPAAAPVAAAKKATVKKAAVKKAAAVTKRATPVKSVAKKATKAATPAKAASKAVKKTAAPAKAASKAVKKAAVKKAAVKKAAAAKKVAKKAAKKSR